MIVLRASSSFRQVENERRSLADFTFYCNRPVRRRDQFPAYRKAQARSAPRHGFAVGIIRLAATAFVFGTEKRIENVRQDFWRDTWTRVGHAYLDAISGSALRFDGQPLDAAAHSSLNHR